MAALSRVILIVDALADQREMYCQYLAACGFTVREAADGQTALVTAAECRPEVVATELQLPRLDGLALCSRLKKQDQRIQVIAVSARAFPSDLAAARSAGFDLVLQKPCLPGVLAAAIQSLLGDAHLAWAASPQEYRVGRELQGVAVGELW